MHQSTQLGKNCDVVLPEAAETVIETTPGNESEATTDMPDGEETSMGNLEQAMESIARAFVSNKRARSVKERVSLINQVRDMDAAHFSGSTDPADAEEWMRNLEKIFHMLRCSDDQKVFLARFLLEGSAYDWWTWIERDYLEPSTITWEEFRRQFNDKYIPHAYLDAKLREFLLLEQGSMTVGEYENKFIKLSRYGPSLVADEIETCRRFEYGLRREIRMTVTAVGWKEFRGLVEAAKRVEHCMNDTQSDVYGSAV